MMILINSKIENHYVTLSWQLPHFHLTTLMNIDNKKVIILLSEVLDHHHSVYLITVDSSIIRLIKVSVNLFYCMTLMNP